MECGSYARIVPSAATGTGLGNYAISYVNSQLTVDPATLTITANSASKTYGTSMTFSPTAYTYTVTGQPGTGVPGTENILPNGDTMTVGTDTSLEGAPASASVGIYNIVPGTATVGDSGNNYAIVYDPGQLTVNPATLTITANNDSKPYGTVKTFSPTAYTYTVTGQPGTGVPGTANILPNGDTITSMTG